MMTPTREAKVRQAVKATQADLTVILENIFDPLNISAVLRSCDAVGIREVFVLYTKAYLDKRGLVLGKRSSAGAFKWTDVYVFEDLDECFRRVRERYGRILTTHLGEQTESVYKIDLTQPTALLFGNEDEGVSAEALSKADGNFYIPQVGFAESLNISVACAVTLFEARRQRDLIGRYDDNPVLDTGQQEQLFARWSNMLRDKSINHQQAIPVGKDAAPLLPVYTERAPDAAPRKQIRPNPLTKFEL